jgi:hypothetical protein
MSDELDNFIDEILKAKGMDKAADDVYHELQADLKTRLLDQIDRAVVNAMPEDKIDELNDLMEKNPAATDAEIQKIVQSSGVDTVQITAETLLRFRDLYLGNAIATERL